MKREKLIDLEFKIADYYKKMGIKVNYDPNSSIYKTWFGRDVPIKFDLKGTEFYSGLYDSYAKEIHVSDSDKLDEIAKTLLHEIGHANTITGSTKLTDITMIPSMLLAAKLTEEGIYNGFNLIGAGIYFVLVTLLLRESIGELLAEGYKHSKMIFRNKKDN